MAGLATVSVRSARDASAALERARAARETGDPTEEIVELGRAIRARVPGTAAAMEASRALAGLATRAAEEGRPETALEAWRELRSSWLAVRAVGQPGREWIERAEAELADLGAVREARIRPRLAGAGWSLLAGASLLAWTGAGVGFLMTGMDPEGRIRAGGGRWLLAAGSGFGLWLLALLRA